MAIARWAKTNGLSKAEGHKKGSDIAHKLVPKIMELSIPYLTLYTFFIRKLAKNGRRGFNNNETTKLLCRK